MCYPLKYYTQWWLAGFQHLQLVQFEDVSHIALLLWWVLMVGICASTIYFPPSLNIVWGNLLCITSLPSISDIHLTAGKIFAVCRQNTIIHFESVYIMRQLIILHLLVLSLWWITINFVMSVSMSEMEPVPK